MSLAYVARDKTISLDPIIEYLEEAEKFVANIKQIEAEEEKKNEQLQYSHQSWTHKNVYSHLTYTLSRVDGAMVEYKSLSECKNTLIHQASSIRRLYVHMRVNYSTMENGKTSGLDYLTTFDLSANVNGFKFEYDINPDEKEFVEKTNDFVTKIDQMPVKLDRIVKFKDLIIMKVGFGIGMIPAIILAFASIFVPQIKEFLHSYFWVYPVAVFAIGFIFGVFFGGMKLGSSYSRLIPTKYGGYDTRTHSSYRVDDMDTFCEQVDVLMGEKASIGSTRKYIEKTEKTIGRLIIPELIAVAVTTAIAFFITVVAGGN